jgi:hypothetical protein
MKAASTSETSVKLYQTALHNNPEDSHLHTLFGDKLKSHDTDHRLNDFLNYP